ncbi:MAG TPA: hypothetical protein VGB94_00070 [Acidobacteriaceae bacterium]
MFRSKYLLLAFLLCTLSMPAVAQHHDDFYNGARQGGRGGHYDRGHDYRHDDRRHDNGIGPGKGALIGGAGGAVLGLAFGGGAKGAIIGGAAGAGIGAALGANAQNNRRDRDYRR